MTQAEFKLKDLTVKNSEWNSLVLQYRLLTTDIECKKRARRKIRDQLFALQTGYEQGFEEAFEGTD